ncbi:MAG TPA: hypothetical protein VE307_01460 [Nitrososphaeraceae archaeon]|jgi:hypothetical protein|nr:hypothetical protein [Nitrososphaeraceae archaeon]
MVDHQDNKNNPIRHRKRNIQQRALQSSISDTSKQQIVSIQVPPNRRNEIEQFLKLFGYNSEKTILQVHLIGFFRKKNLNQREIEQKSKSVKRYGGTSFIVVGRTYDPAIIENVIGPKSKDPLESSPGYIGYLWKDKNPQNKPPHELIPLDFIPVHLPYPDDWKKMFATKGFLIAMHVPTSFVKDKNKITRALYRIAKNGPDVRKEWNFLNDLKNLGYYTHIYTKS